MVFESSLCLIWLLRYPILKTALLMHFQWGVQTLQAHYSFLHFARKGPLSHILSQIVSGIKRKSLERTVIVSWSGRIWRDMPSNVTWTVPFGSSELDLLYKSA
jgi:hypothetical protein